MCNILRLLAQLITINQSQGSNLEILISEASVIAFGLVLDRCCSISSRKRATNKDGIALEVSGVCCVGGRSLRLTAEACE